MGFFDRNKDAAPADGLTTPEGLAGIAVCAVYADGSMGAAEDASLAANCAKLKPFRDARDRALDEAFRKVHRIALARGDHALLDECAAAVPERLRSTAFFVAADLVLGDDEFGDAEEDFLVRAQKAIRVNDETSRRILDVLAIKHAA